MFFFVVQMVKSGAGARGIYFYFVNDIDKM